jgi:hypothetical protein
MTDQISQRPAPPLDPPERFAGGEVVAAARCPAAYPARMRWATAQSWSAIALI